jgi:peptide/nickel transport system substrate-binding protein
LLLAALLVVACGAPTPAAPGQAPGQGAPARSNTGPKRIVAATHNVPSFLYYRLHPGPTAGAEEIGDLLHSGLVVVDDQSTLRPQLSEAVPTLENGRWRVFPDGAMETTVTLRPGVQWHDGAPLTARDLAFTLDVSADRELGILRHVGFDSIESYSATDDRTLVVKWRRPYIEADALFSTRFALPLPRHLLERPFQESKATFFDLPFWAEEYVGAGPFKVREHARGAYLIADAFDRYALGRPKVDEIEVRFITDENTFMANLLSGAVHFTLGRGPSLEQALMSREQWRDGRVEFKSLDSWLVVYPQFLNPNPPIVANPQFRSALLHAIDRQEMVESIQHGLVPVADGNISPNHPRYREIEPSIVRHPHDPRRAAQLLEGLGYTRGGDGGWRDAAGARLSVQIRGTTVLDILPKATLSVADSWQRLGVATEADIRSSRALDREQQATFPGFALQRQTGSHRFLPNLRGSQVRLPENGFNGLNVARYADPEMDALIDRYVTTIPIAERTQVIAEIVRRITGEAIWLTLFFDTEPALIANRLVNVGPRGEDSNHAWNAHEWDVKS